MLGQLVLQQVLLFPAFLDITLMETTALLATPFSLIG
jgi:hypothetical protein